jgi:hypothetical protein
MKQIQILSIILLILFSSKIYGQQSESSAKEKTDNKYESNFKTPKISALDSAEYSFHVNKVFVNPFVGFYRDTNPFGIGLEYALTNYFGLGVGLSYSPVFSKSIYSGKITEGSKVISSSVGLNLHLGQAFKSRMIDIVPGVAWGHTFGGYDTNVFVGGIEMRIFVSPHVGINFGQSFGLTENTEGLFAVGLVFK